MTNPVIVDVCKKHGIDVSTFFSSARGEKLMACRAEAARIFRDKGHSWEGAAILLRRNRDTVRYWLDPRVREFRKKYMVRRWRELQHEARP